MSITGRDLFRGAYRDAGLVELALTELGPDEEEEARQTYNRMVDAWRADGTTVSHIARILMPITGGKGDYTIGPGGDWDPTPQISVAWPDRIERAGLVLTNQTPNPEYPLYPLTVDQYQLWTLKQLQINWSRAFFYERAFPLGIVHLLYPPTDANQIALYLENPISQIDAVDVGLDFPPGYQLAIESNLAVKLAAKNPDRAKITEEVRETARESLDRIRNANNRPLMRNSDLRQARRSNIYTGSRYNL